MAIDIVNQKDVQRFLKDTNKIQSIIRNNREKASKKVRVLGQGFVGRTLETSDFQKSFLQKAPAKSFFGKAELVNFTPDQIEEFEKILRRRKKKFPKRGLVLDDIIVISKQSPTFGTVKYADPGYESKTPTVRQSGRRVYSIKKINVIKSSKRLPSPKLTAFKSSDSDFKLIFQQGGESGKTSHRVTVQLKGWYDSMSNLRLTKNKNNKISFMKNVQDALFEQEISVSCTCESWRYFFAYKATQLNYNAGRPERGFPKERNRELKGGTCKHVINSLVYLKQNKKIHDFLEKKMSEMADKTIQDNRTKFLKKNDLSSLNQQKQSAKDIQDALKKASIAKKGSKELDKKISKQERIEKLKPNSKQKNMLINTVKFLRSQNYNDEGIANFLNQDVSTIKAIK